MIYNEQHYSNLINYKLLSLEELKKYSDYRGFIWACTEGNLDLIKLMYSINPYIEISGDQWNREFPFKIVCAHGYLEIAKWFLEVNPLLDLSIDVEDPFRYACREGHLNVAQWLLSVKPDIDISCCFDKPFRNACYNGHLEVAQWLLSVKPDINIPWSHDDAFRSACDNNHIDVAEWLCSIKPEYNIWVDDESIVGYSILGKQIFYYNSYITEEKENECCICYETSNIKTNCGHYGCEECFSKLKQKICPYCRQDITEISRIVIN